MWPRCILRTIFFNLDADHKYMSKTGEEHEIQAITMTTPGEYHYIAFVACDVHNDPTLLEVLRWCRATYKCDLNAKPPTRQTRPEC